MRLRKETGPTPILVWRGAPDGHPDQTRQGLRLGFPPAGPVLSCPKPKSRTAVAGLTMDRNQALVKAESPSVMEQQPQPGERPTGLPPLPGEKGRTVPAQIPPPSSRGEEPSFTQPIPGGRAALPPRARRHRGVTGRGRCVLGARFEAARRDGERGGRRGGSRRAPVPVPLHAVRHSGAVHGGAVRRAGGWPGRDL